MIGVGAGWGAGGGGAAPETGGAWGVPGSGVGLDETTEGAGRGTLLASL